MKLKYFIIHICVSATCGTLFALYESIRDGIHAWDWHLVQWLMITLYFWNAFFAGTKILQEDTIFSRFGVSGVIFIMAGVGYVFGRKCFF